jgi:hypothetical protein
VGSNPAGGTIFRRPRAAQEASIVLSAETVFMINGDPVGVQERGDRLVKITRIAPILAFFIASFTACASQHSRLVSSRSSGVLPISRWPPACTLASKVWTCWPEGKTTIGTVVLFDNQEITMGPGAYPGQFFTIRLAQNSVGGHVPKWSKSFEFQSSYAYAPNTIVPVTFPNATENILFQYDSFDEKWIYLSRSTVQQLASVFQGAGTSIGDHPGRESSTKALFLPANIETGVFGDNGGFFGPEGNGVVSYAQIQSGVIQFCNYDATTTLATFRCNRSGGWRTAIAQTAPVQVPAGGCTEFNVQMLATSDQAANTFTGYVCYINPGNSTAAYATWNSVYNEEVPAN